MTMSQQLFGKTYGGSGPENYERYFVPAIGAPVAADLITTAALRPGERVLDVACGTGVVARLAKERVGTTGTVAGLDFNPGMLAVARSVTPPGLTIEWYEASAEAMPLPDEAFDVVLSQMGLQFVSDKPAALREMQRVLVPGGRLALNVPGPIPPLFAILAEALEHHIGPEAAGGMRMVFSLQDPVEFGNLLNSAGFQDVDVQPVTKTLRLPPPEEFLWQYLQSTPLAAMVANVEDQHRAALEREVVAGQQPFVQEGALILELGIVIATARK
jgi:SAM-dependent methyltransferase